MFFILYLLSAPGVAWRTCRPVCDGDSCITANRERLVYRAAAETCRRQNGELLTFQSDADKRMFDLLSQDSLGDFWIGLRLPAGSCSDPSRPLRGYQPVSGSTNWTFSPSSNDWTSADRVCSLRCVSLSDRKKWSEKLCSDAVDGFLCKTKHKDACVGQTASESVFFRSSETCKSAPCEQRCTDERDGFSCSCWDGFAPDGDDPRRCKVHCAQKTCPLMCEDQSSCFCPDGFISNEKFCEDIDECEMDYCAQDCQNTYGGFLCSCRDGFLLRDRVQCVKAEQTSTPVVRFVKPAAKNTTQKGSSPAGGATVWVWVVLVVVVAVSVVVIRALVQHQRNRKESSAQTEA